MLTLIRLKRAAAILLMICFVLPLSRCERGGVAAAVQAVAGGASAPVQQAGKPAPVYDYKYAFQNLSLGDPAATLLNLAAFFWPLVLAFAFRGQPGRAAATWLNLLELLLCAGSAYMIYGITLFGTLWFGGYLAYLAVGAYFALTLTQLLLRYRMQPVLR